MWQLIAKQGMPPTRIARYCCKYFKENTISDKVIATGVRWAESPSRASLRKPIEAVTTKKADKFGYDPTSKQMSFLSNDNDIERKIAEHCEMGKKTAINPIIKFSDTEIWNIIDTHHIKLNQMYAKGYERVGCIGCPMASKQMKLKEFSDYPIFKERYIRAFGEMLKKLDGKQRKWNTAEEVFEWWIESDSQNGQGELWDK